MTKFLLATLLALSPAYGYASIPKQDKIPISQLAKLLPSEEEDDENTVIVNEKTIIFVNGVRVKSLPDNFAEYKVDFVLYKAGTREALVIMFVDKPKKKQED